MSHRARLTTIPQSTPGASSIGASGAFAPRSGNQPSNLAARVAAKRAELENIQRLRDASIALTTQLETLEAKLATLHDGAQAVAYVMANFDNVLKVVNLASSALPQNKLPVVASTESAMDNIKHSKPPLPTPVVRVPIHESTIP
ncbi:hypothetical protein FQN57_001043 [Myotisia sp. PD_48]|nr:hypothetical protein FQN57_001043 [Myotisia sp. PD_48]